jgi:hypothetical protein
MNRTQWLVLSVLIATRPLGAEELKVPTLPKSTVLAGNFVYDGQWYAMNSAEIASVTKVLAGKPYRTPKDIIHESLPAPSNRIILWGQEGGRLVPTDVIETDFRASFLHSQRKADVYNTHSKQGQPLRKMIERIQGGRLRPLAIDPEESASEKPTARSAN